MHMRKSQAKRLLQSHENILYGIPTDAVMRYTRDFESVRYRLGKRSDASIIHDLMIELAADRLSCLAEFKPMYSQGLHFYYVSDGRLSATLRFKKLDDRMRSRNIPTQQAYLFNHQEPQYELPNMPPVANLTLGYTLSATRTSASSVFVIMPNGERNIWTWQLQGPSIEQIPSVGPRPSDGNLMQALRSMKRRTQSDGF